jgi:1,4-dihydroxy-2-naphthoate octaprenyltransferase
MVRYALPYFSDFSWAPLQNIINQLNFVSIMLLKEIQRVLVHIRWPLQSYTLLGLLFGIVILRVPLSTDLIFGFISWFFLCAGITLFNSYYDKDKGSVAGLERPPKTTESLFVGAWLFKIIGFVIALSLNNLFLGIYIFGVLLSVLYSHKNFRFKSNGYVAVLFNFIIGTMTFIIASSFAQMKPLVLTFGCITAGLFLASIYLMMQIHQKDEDKERGDISIAVLFGKKKTLISAIVIMVIASIFAIFSLFLSQYPIILIFVFVLFFIIVIFLSIIWLRKKENSFTDFRIMNKLTLGLSNIANILLLSIYIFFVLN